MKRYVWFTLIAVAVFALALLLSGGADRVLQAGKQGLAPKAAPGATEDGPLAGNQDNGIQSFSQDARPSEAKSETRASAQEIASRRIVQRPTRVPIGEEASFLKSLKPRPLPVKEALHVPEGNDLRLSVKLADPLAGRADALGRLVLHADEKATILPLSQFADAHDLKFRRVHTASDEQIAALTRRAAEKTGVAQADLAAVVEVVMPAPDRDKVVALARELHALAAVEWVELEALDLPPPPPAADIAPTTPLLVSNQTYRGAATGVDVDYVWNTLGIRGNASIRISDCEYDFNPDHEDLAGLVQMQPNVVSRYQGFGNGHGTSVLGILASGDNAYGTSGGAPQCTYFFYPESSTLTTGTQNRTACVTAALAASGEGDIVVLEMQTGGPGPGSTDYVPAEYVQGVWNVVKAASDAGILTIAAGGNGSQNLDDAALFASYAARGDSGAIIVGAGDAGRSKLGFSTYGSRVNVQGWGTGVFTTGSTTSGTYVYGGDANQSYITGFSGTSSATPIVTSAAALLQSVAIKYLGSSLPPGEIRRLLVSTGRAQTGGLGTTPIGPLPNLKAAVQALFTEDPDGDGLSNLMEYVLATDPLSDLPADATRVPRVTTTQGSGGASQVVMEFNQPTSRTGAAWEVQRSRTLLPGSWQTLVHGTAGTQIVRTGSTVRVTVPAAAAGQRSYLRVQASVN